MDETYESMKERSKASDALLKNELEKRGAPPNIDYVEFLWEDMGVCLDGYFSLIELEALVAVMWERAFGSLAFDSF